MSTLTNLLVDYTEEYTQDVVCGICFCQVSKYPMFSRDINEVKMAQQELTHVGMLPNASVNP